MDRQKYAVLKLTWTILLLSCFGGCKHVEGQPSSPAMDDHRIGKPQYTPKQQRDVKEVITFLKKPL